MKVVIAEKPSVARELANVIGASVRKPEWFEGNGYRVTWLYGHLLELDVPEANGPWVAKALPILPAKFLLKPIKHERKGGQRDRLDVLRELFRDCDYIIVATDAGREGELIFRNLYDYLNIPKPFKRLWVSSLTDQAISKGFAELLDGHDFDNMAEAARQRERADWMVGINATRAFSLACGCRQGMVLSLGRVQTPTLCMICRRYIENARFKPEPYWYLDGASVKDGVTFKWKGKDRYTNDPEKGISGKDLGERDRNDVQGRGVLTVTSVKTDRVSEAPPLLFDIDSLQKAANSKYGYTLDQSLAIAQSLYEKRFLTYPRTSSRYIPEDVFAKVPDLLETVTGDEVYGETAKGLLKDRTKLNRRSVNDTKITDHHALIITENRPTELSEEERNVYELVLVRFLEALSPVCVADKTVVEMIGGTKGVMFVTNGRKDVSLGWRAVAKTGDYENVELDDVDEVELSMRPLPEMKQGDLIPIGKLELVEDATKPRPLLTDATLLTEMENAGRKSDDKEVVEALKEIGIGTAATRAETLKTLIERGYVVRSKKKLMPTDLGLEVFAAVKDKAIANIELTARWEIALREIEDGARQGSDFEERIRRFTERLTKEILSGGGLDRIRKRVEASIEKLVLKCPKCGHEVRNGEKSIWCNDKDGGCGFVLWKDVIAGKKLGDETWKTLVRKGETGVLTGFRSKAGNEFSARLRLDSTGKQGRVILEPEWKNNQSHGGGLKKS